MTCEMIFDISFNTSFTALSPMPFSNKCIVSPLCCASLAIVCFNYSSGRGEKKQINQDNHLLKEKNSFRMLGNKCWMQKTTLAFGTLALPGNIGFKKYQLHH